MFPVSVMWNFSPSMVFIFPSKTVGNSRLMSKVRTGWPAVIASRCGLVGGDGLV